MIEFGKTLRAAREAKGLTTSEVAEKTHILVQQVEALENEDFSKIAAPIYGRGFVKLYCEAVGIPDYKPLVDEFMDIYSGNRPPTIRMKNCASIDNSPVAEASHMSPDDQQGGFDAFTMSGEDNAENEALANVEPETEGITETTEIPQPLDTFDDFLTSPDSGETMPEAAEAEPASEEPPPPPPDNLFDFAIAAENQPQPKAKNDEKATASIDELFKETETQATPRRSQGPSRYSTPKPLEYETKKRFDIPPAVWRLGLLAIVAIFILWLVIAGVSALYRAAIPSDESAENTQDVSETTPVASDKDRSSPDSSKRTPMKIQPLYMNFND